MRCHDFMLEPVHFAEQAHNLLCPSELIGQISCSESDDEITVIGFEDGIASHRLDGVAGAVKFVAQSEVIVSETPSKIDFTRLFARRPTCEDNEFIHPFETCYERIKDPSFEPAAHQSAVQ